MKKSDIYEILAPEIFDIDSLDMYGVDWDRATLITINRDGSVAAHFPVRYDHALKSWEQSVYTHLGDLRITDIPDDAICELLILVDRESFSDKAGNSEIADILKNEILTMLCDSLTWNRPGYTEKTDK